MELSFVPLLSYFIRLNPNAFAALHNAWSPILASIFAGNGVVLKCSEHVLWSTSWFVTAIKECLRECGHNTEIVQVSVVVRLLWLFG